MERKGFRFHEHIRDRRVLKGQGRDRSRADRIGKAFPFGGFDSMQAFVSHLPPEPGGAQITGDALRSQFDSLRTAVLRLNRAMDEVNRAVDAVERFLDSIDMGITARVPNPFRRAEESGCDEKGREALFRIEHRLACGRPPGGGFSIHVIITTLIRYPGDDVHKKGWQPFSEAKLPWPSCSREIRIEAARHLPDLLAEVAVVANDMTDRAQKTAEILSSSQPV